MRVLSYNIHKGIGGRDRKYRLERIAEVIESQNPDLICLQEVDHRVPRSNHDDQPHVLAERLRTADSFYQLNVKLKSGGYGNLILSRWPIVVRHSVSLTMWLKKPRGAQLSVVDTPEGPLHLVNWHLGLADFERHWQVKKLMSHHLFRENQSLPTLIMGDYNDWRNTLRNGSFQEHLFSQVTHPVSRFRSFPAWFPLGSLDKAFIRGAIDVHDAKLVRTPLSHVASDHLPLVVDFHLNGHVPAAQSKQEDGGTHRHAH